MNLYEFKTEGETLRLTSAKANVTIAGVEYTATSMHRTEYALDPIITKNTIVITFPGDFQFARQFMTETTLSLTVVISTIEGTPFYRGKLVMVEYTPELNVALIFEPIVILGNKSTGQRRLFQRNCPYELYGSHCQAVPLGTTLRVIEVPSALAVKLRYDTGNADNGNRGDLRYNVIPIRGTLTNSRANIGFLVGGLLIPTASRGVLPDGRSVERRLWITNITDRAAMGSIVEFVALTFRAHSLRVGDQADVAVGCKRTTASCREIHNNIENYGGFPGMVNASPYAGGLRS